MLQRVTDIPKATDEELVVRYKAGHDIQVLGQLYQPYMDLVYGVCLKYLQDTEDAKDAVINIFEELVSKLKKYDVADFRSWLYQLSKNHCLMKMRSEKKFGKKMSADVVHLETNNHLDMVVEKELLLNGMEYCLQQLPPEQQQAIQYFYLGEKSYREIAEETGLALTKVRSYIQNGRRNLKLCMEKNALEKANNG